MMRPNEASSRKKTLEGKHAVHNLFRRRWPQKIARCFARRSQHCRRSEPSLRYTSGSDRRGRRWTVERSEEHTSELQSLMRISYAVFCLKKKNQTPHIHK